MSRISHGLKIQPPAGHRGRELASHMTGPSDHVRGGPVGNARGLPAHHTRGAPAGPLNVMSASHASGAPVSHTRGESANHIRGTSANHIRGTLDTHISSSNVAGRSSNPMNDTSESHASGVSHASRASTIYAGDPSMSHMRGAVSSHKSAATACQFVLYSNDAMDVAYSDGSRLQLSPCGSTFVYHHAPPPDAHPLQAGRRVQQRSEFVTSDYRAQVLQALDLRNRYAQRPFLCRQLFKDRVLRVHANIEEVAWPAKLTADNIIYLPSGGIKVTSEDEYASISLSYHHLDFTVDYLAKVSHRTHKVKSKSGNSSSEQIHTHQSSENANSLSKSSSSSSLSSSSSSVAQDTEAEERSRWDYVWLTQHHSIHDCPPCWQHILTLMLNLNTPTPSNIQLENETTFDGESDSPVIPSAQDVSNNEQNVIGDVKNNSDSVNSDKSCSSTGSTIRRLLKKDFSRCVFSEVPKTLPLNCAAQHLHRWRQNDVIISDESPAEAIYMHGKVKVICIHSAVYRLLRSPEHAVEVYPGDGSIIRSSSLSGFFFNHYLYSNHKVEERMYSIKTLPLPNPVFNYSVAKLITRASRFLQQLCDTSSQLSSTEDLCCWKSSPSVQAAAGVHQPTVRLEECEVEGVGRFVAYSNGHIRIVFSDRTCLDMCMDVTKRLAWQHMPTSQTVQESSGLQARHISSSQLLNLPEGVCRLLLRTGHYHHVIISNPEGYERYVQPAVEWASWVNTLPSQRAEFYKDTLYDPDKQKMIDKELRKIQCFNYIVEHSVNPGKFPSASDKPQLDNPDRRIDSAPTGHHSNGSPSAAAAAPDSAADTMDFSMVRDILKRTSMAVKELDQMLANNGEMEPVRD